MNIKENLIRSKEVLAAYWRQGLHELGAAFYGAGTVAQHPEYGMAGTKTPGQVAEGIRGQDPADKSKDVSRNDPAPSPLDKYTSREPAQERSEREPEREPPTMERD